MTNLTWLPVNDAPSFSLDSITVPSTIETRIAISALLTDIDTPLEQITLSIPSQPDKGGAVSIEGNELVFALAGIHRIDNITIIADDGEDQSQQSLLIQVTSGGLARVGEFSITAAGLELMAGNETIVSWSVENPGNTAVDTRMALTTGENIVIHLTTIPPGETRSFEEPWLLTHEQGLVELVTTSQSRVENGSISQAYSILPSELRFIGLSSGDILSGIVDFRSYSSGADEIKLIVSGSQGPVKEIWADAPYFNLSIDSMSITNGDYELRIMAYDQGVAGNSVTIGISVQNNWLRLGAAAQISTGVIIWIVLIAALYFKDRVAEDVAKSNIATEGVTEIFAEEVSVEGMVKEMESYSDEQTKMRLIEPISLFVMSGISVLIGLGFALGISVGLSGASLSFDSLAFSSALPITIPLGMLLTISLVSSDVIVSKLEGMKRLSYRFWPSGGVAFIISSIGLGAPYGFPGHTRTHLGKNKEPPPAMDSIRVMSKAFTALAFPAVGVLLSLITGNGMFAIIATSMGVMLFFFLTVPSRHLEGGRIYEHSKFLSLGLLVLSSILFLSLELQLWGGSGAITQGRGLGGSALIGIAGFLSLATILLILVMKRHRLRGQALLEGVFTHLDTMEQMISQVSKEQTAELTALTEFDLEEEDEAYGPMWVKLLNELGANAWILSEFRAEDQASVGAFYRHLNFPVPNQIRGTRVQRKEPCLNCRQMIWVTEGVCPNCHKSAPTPTQQNYISNGSRVILAAHQRILQEVDNARQKINYLRLEVKRIDRSPVSGAKKRMRAEPYLLEIEALDEWLRSH